MERNGKANVHLYLPMSLYNLAKQRAKREGVPITRIFIQALEQLLRRTNDDR